MIDVFVWCIKPGRWKAYAPILGMGVAASSRSEALRQLRHAAHDEMEWGRELRIIEGAPSKEAESLNETINESILYLDRDGLQWMAVHKPSNRCAVGATEAEARELFEKVHNQDLPPYRVIRGRPPLPRRPDAAPQEENLIDADSKFHRALLKAFHSDHHGQRKRFSCDEIVAVTNAAWKEAR